MVNVTPIQAFDHELSGEAEIFADFYGLFINNLRGEVLCDAAVVNIAQLVSIILVVEQVVYIDVVDITLNGLEVNSVF